MLVSDYNVELRKGRNQLLGAFAVLFVFIGLDAIFDYIAGIETAQRTLISLVILSLVFYGAYNRRGLSYRFLQVCAGILGLGLILSMLGLPLAIYMLFAGQYSTSPVLEEYVRAIPKLIGIGYLVWVFFFSTAVRKFVDRDTAVYDMKLSE